MKKPFLNHLEQLSAVKPKRTTKLNPMMKNSGAKKEPPQETSRAKQMFQGQGNAKRQKKVPRLEQWVEVRIRDGQTVTTLYPPNDQIIKEGQKMLPPPEMVYRRINFPEGIPDEYLWTGPVTDDQRQRGGCGIQRLTVDAWLEAIEAEKLRGDGHIGASKTGNLPRPKETGGCECPACIAKQEYLDATTAPSER